MNCSVNSAIGTGRHCQDDRTGTDGEFFAIARNRNSFAFGTIMTYVTNVLDFGEKERIL
jgi:hypothetical protein